MTRGLYREVSGTGDAILLIHGNGANTRIWGRSADDLAATHRVIAYDRRGFGRSPGPPATSMRDHVADAAALLRELDAAPATVLGWSGGGAVAAGLAAEHPELVSSLVLEEGAVHLARNVTRTSLLGTLRIEYARRVRRDNRRAAQEVFDWALSYRNGGTQFERWPAEWQESMLASGDAVAAEVDHLRRIYPSRAAVESIGCPVTILEGGLSDPVFPKVNSYVRKRLPAARLVRIAGAAHAIHFDRPEEFRDAVVEASRLAEAEPQPQ